MAGKRSARWGGAALALAALVACDPGAAERADRPGGRVVVSTAALSLAGVGDVVWDLEVVNGRAPTPDVVWRRRISSSSHGDGADSASYVGPCDADPAANPSRVRVWMVGVFAAEVANLGVFAAGAPGGVAGADLDFEDPTALGPLEREVVCTPSADAEARFDVTVARPAEQGFFDIGVSFEDLFCSAKLDCERADGEPLALLFDPATGTRSLTAVLALACTAGPDAGATWLHRDDVRVSCRDGLTFTVQPDLGPGNLDPAFPFTAGTPNTTHLFFQAATYRGEEPLAGAKKAYWNVALGLNAAAFASLGPCTLEARATATDGPLAGGAVAADRTWPVVRWSQTLITADGALTCGRHALGAGPEVAVVYATGNDAALGASCEPLPNPIVRHTAPPVPGGLGAPQSPTLGARHTIDGLFTGYPAPSYEWAGAVPRLGPDADRFYFDYDGTYLTGMLEGFTCPAALGPDDGLTLAIATAGGQVGWLLRVTPSGLASALRDGVDVTASGLAQARIAFATSPHAPSAPHYLVEFEVPAAPGGFSYRVVGADAACAVPSPTQFIYGHCAAGGGIWPPLPTEPATGSPLSPVPAGGVARVPGDFSAPAGLSVTLDGVPVTPNSVTPDALFVAVPPGHPPGPAVLLVCRGDACVRHLVAVYDAGTTTLVTGQPAVYAPPHEDPFGGGGSASFLWGGQPVHGQRSFFCGCGHYDGMPCMMLSWHGGLFRPDASELVVYGGTADGQRLAVIGRADGQVEAWYNGLPFVGTVGRVTEGLSPWSGVQAINLEVCLPLPWSSYVLGLTGPCPTGTCDEAQAIDVRSWSAGRYTEQSPTSAPRIVMVGPGAEPLAAATAQGGLGQAGSAAFVVRGANLGPAAGTAQFQGAVAGPAGLAWSETVVSGTLPAQAEDGPLVLGGSRGPTNAVSVSVGELPPPTPSCEYVRDVLGGTASGIYSYDGDGAGPEPAYPIYCDQSTDGGGWVLIAYWVSGTGGYRLWNDVAVAGRPMKPYSANAATYPVPPIGIVNTYTEQRFATTIAWFATAYGAWVRYPVFPDPMPALGGGGFAGVSALGTNVTLRTAEPYWGRVTTGANAWSLWTGACGGENNCASRACPAMRPYDGYPCHYDFWAPKFLFAR